MPQAAGVLQDCIYNPPTEIVFQTPRLPHHLQHTKIPPRTLRVTSDSDVSLFMRTNETNSKLVTVLQISCKIPATT